VKEPRNLGRAYDRDGRELEPMTLGQMRVHGVRSIDAACNDCWHETSILVDALPDHMPVPDVALVLKCSACGSRNVTTRPDWREHRAPGRG